MILGREKETEGGLAAISNRSNYRAVRSDIFNATIEKPRPADYYDELSDFVTNREKFPFAFNHRGQTERKENEAVDPAAKKSINRRAPTRARFVARAMRLVSRRIFSLTMPAMVFYEARRVSLPLYQVVAFY